MDSLIRLCAPPRRPYGVSRSRTADQGAGARRVLGAGLEPARWPCPLQQQQQQQLPSHRPGTYPAGWESRGSRRWCAAKGGRGGSPEGRSLAWLPGCQSCGTSPRQTGARGGLKMGDALGDAGQRRPPMDGAGCVKRCTGEGAVNAAASPRHGCMLCIFVCNISPMPRTRSSTAVSATHAPEELARSNCSCFKSLR